MSGDSTSGEQVEIQVNGEARKVAAGSTVATLLGELGIDLKRSRVAVERNKLVVPRAEHAGTALAAGDVLEIVHFVGGG